MKHISKLSLLWAFWFITPLTFAQVVFEDISAGLEGDVIYKTVVDGKDNVYIYANSGIWKSSDEGDTWQLMNRNPPPYCFFEADRDGNLYIGYFGIYRSQDQGRTWQVIVPARIGIDSRTHVPYRVHLGQMKVGWNDGLYWQYAYVAEKPYWRSMNKGESPEEISGTQYQVGFLDPDELGYFYKSDGFYLYQSTDAAQWRVVPFKGQIRAHFEASTGEILVISGIKPYLSVDAGKSFFEIPLDAKMCANCEMTYIIGDKGVLRFSWTLGTENFVYETLDFGKTWQRITPTTSLNPLGFAVKNSKGTLFYGTQRKKQGQSEETVFIHRGTQFLYTKTLGNRAITSGKQYESLSKKWVDITDEYLITATQFGWVGQKEFDNNIWLSQDEGATWEWFATLPDQIAYIAENGAVFLKKTVQVPHENGITLISRTQYFKTSLQNVQQVETVSLTLPDNIFARLSEVKGFYFAFSNAFNKATNQVEPIIAMSADQGKTFQYATFTDVNAYMKGIFQVEGISEMEDGTWLLSTSKWNTDRKEITYFASTNEGKTWKPVVVKDYVLSDIDIPRATYSPMPISDSSGNWWILGYQEQAFRATTNPLGEMKPRILHSRDNGASWQEIPDSFEDKTIVQINIDDADFLYVSTENGIYRSKRALQYTFDTHLPVGEKVLLKAPFPNPATHHVSISFDLPTASQVQLEVLNLLGQPMQSIHDGTLPRGNYVFQWQPTQAASGVYIVRFEANGVVQTKRVVVLR